VKHKPSEAKTLTTDPEAVPDFLEKMNPLGLATSSNNNV